MILSLPVQYEVCCDAFCKAKSHQAYAQANKTNGELLIFHRKSDMVVEQVFLFLWRMLLRSLQPIYLLVFYILLFLTCLFRFVCTFFWNLGIVFLLILQFFQKELFCILSLFHTCIACNKFYTHLSLLSVCKIQTVAFLFDKIYNASWVSPLFNEVMDCNYFARGSQC